MPGVLLVRVARMVTCLMPGPVDALNAQRGVQSLFDRVGRGDAAAVRVRQFGDEGGVILAGGLAGDGVELGLEGGGVEFGVVRCSARGCGPGRQ